MKKGDVLDTGKEIIIGVLSGGVFLVSLLLLKLNIIVSLLMTTGIFTGLSLLFKTKKEENMTISLGEVDPVYLKDAIGKANKKISEIKSVSKTITGTEQLNHKIKKVITTAEAIVADFEQDPGDVKRARNFLNYYLDATIKILKSYHDIGKYVQLDQKSRETLLKVEKLLDQIGDAFEKQLNRLLENDVMNLDAEITLLEKTLKMEGWEE